MLEVSAEFSKPPGVALDGRPPLLPPQALLLAPMVALSHRALRELVFGFDAGVGDLVEAGHPPMRLGLDLAYTEMTSAAALSAHSTFDESFVDAGPEPSRVVYQFYTTKPERLPEALALVSDRGAFGADINFGCSAPHILRAGGGAAWMREPEAAAGLIRLARSAWTSTLSAKLRIGAEDDYERLRDFCLGLVAAGIDFLTLHPRLEGQKFRRRGRWDYVGRLVEDLPVPVVGNGDIRGFEDWSRWVSEAKPAGIMIGREAVRRPWIFALIRGREADPSFELTVDLRETAFRFLDLIEARLPPEFHETRAKRFFSYYCDNFSFAHHLNVKLQRAPDLDSMRLVLDEYLAEMPTDRLLIEGA